MRKVVRVVVTSALLSIGAASGAAAGGWDYTYQYGGYQYGGGYGYAGNGGGCGCGGCGCGGGYRGYAVQQAYETQPPVYVVNQGPSYTGPGISVPILNYWSHGGTRAYPYIRGGHHGYHQSHHYSGDGYSTEYQPQHWRRAAYAPQYPRYERPRFHAPRPYYRSRVLRVYGSADMQGARAHAYRRHTISRRIDPRDLPIK
jgi:hypothetical protein